MRQSYFLSWNTLTLICAFVCAPLALADAAPPPVQTSPPAAKKAPTSSTQAVKGQNTTRIAKKDKDDDIPLPRVRAVAPLPSVYRDLRIDTSPSALPIEIRKEDKRLDCLPANRTPCKVRVFGYKKVIPLKIIVRRGKQEYRYTRNFKGRNQSLQEWTITLPTQARVTPTRTPPRIPPRTPPPSTSKGVPTWVWVVSTVAVLGAGSAGLAYYLTNRNKLGFRCNTCSAN